MLSNLVNNLPGYVALEPAVAPDRLLYLLAGTNLGPLALPWGSLATVIWFERVRAAGLPVDWRRFVATGTVTAVLTLTATVTALALPEARAPAPARRLLNNGPIVPCSPVKAQVSAPCPGRRSPCSGVF